MADSVEIKVRGDARLTATMRAAGRKMGDLRAANQRVASRTAQEARGRAPKRSGALARSTSGKAAAGNTARLTATVVYAGVIHNGWPRHNISPQPFLRETVEAQEGQIVAQYGDEVDKILGTVRGA